MPDRASAMILGAGGRWLAASAFWTLVTLLAASQSLSIIAAAPSEADQLTAALVWQSVYFLLWIPFTVVVWRLSDVGTPGDLGWSRFVALHAGSALVVAVGHAALAAFLAWTIVVPAGESLAPIQWSYVRSRLATQIVVYAAALGSAQAMLLYSRWRSGEAAAARLEAQLAQARLAALGAQLHPHVLFNSLHAIASLVREGRNDEAVRLISGMSDLLRQMLDTGDRPLRLEEELALVQRFVELQQVRFDDRLDVSITLDPSVRSVAVPPLIVQPLAENAIRHGLAGRAGSGRLSIRACRIGEDVVVEVEDDGVGVPEGWTLDRSGGTGLRTLRARLDARYGARARLDLHSVPGRGCRVRLRLPLEMAAP